ANQDGVALQFSLNPTMAEAAEGQQIWLRIEEIAALYARHQAAGAEIVAPLEPKPWGLSEYIVRDLNGYRLRFAGHPSATGVSREMPPGIRIESRLPTWPEMRGLIDSVGWERPAELDT